MPSLRQLSRFRRPVPARRAALASALLAATFAAAPAAAQPTVYLAFGDSITEGVHDDSGRARPGYVPLLENRLINVGVDAVVEEHGKGGETTLGGLSRINRVLDGGGDVLLLMEGTNDVQNGISPETTAFNLGEMARRARARGIETVHATVIPRYPRARVDPENRTTAAIAAEIRELAWEERRRLADPFAVFGTTPDLFDRFYADVASDRIGHPNGDGYDLLADVFFAALIDRDTVGPVPGRVFPAEGAAGVSPNAALEVVLYDFGAGLDLSALDLTVDGLAVPTEVAGDEGRATLTASLSSRPAGPVDLGVLASDLAEPANVADRTLATFEVGEGAAERLPGDVDGDGRVDGADLVALALRFGAAAGEPRYSPLADFDGDGVIDGVDLAILAASFGEGS